MRSTSSALNYVPLEKVIVKLAEPQPWYRFTSPQVRRSQISFFNILGSGVTMFAEPIPNGGDQDSYRGQPLLTINYLHSVDGAARAQDRAQEVLVLVAAYGSSNILKEFRYLPVFPSVRTLKYWNRQFVIGQCVTDAIKFRIDLRQTRHDLVFICAIAGSPAQSEMRRAKRSSVSSRSY